MVNCVYPLAVKELTEELTRSSIVTVSINSSNRKEIKSVPVLVRYFVPNVGIQVKVLEFKSFPGETSDFLCQHVLLFLNER